MPGSAVNLSDANTILNTAMAKSLKEFADAMEGKSGDEFEAAAIAYIKDDLRKHQRIIFNGNGYSDEWPVEAERRGLANHPHDCRRAAVLHRSEEHRFVRASSTCSPRSRFAARYEVKLEKYNKLLNIEARTMKRMVRRFFLPAINSFAADVARDIAQVKAALPSADQTFQEKKLQTVVDGTKRVEEALDALNTAHLANVEIADQQERANDNAHHVIPLMDELRAAIDAMEIVVDDNHWPVPTYNEILFYC